MEKMKNLENEQLQPLRLSADAKNYLRRYNPSVSTEIFSKLVCSAKYYATYTEYVYEQISYMPWMGVFFQDSEFDDVDEGYDYEWQLVESVLRGAWNCAMS